MSPRAPTETVMLAVALLLCTLVLGGVGGWVLHVILMR